jgi:hypothetical protein
MSMTATSGSLASVNSPTTDAAPVRVRVSAKLRRRRISREAGRAIEMLGHAIEYLADEFALECMSSKGSTAGRHPQVEAIELLMARNREVYFACPELPTMARRLKGWLGLERLSE